MGMPAATKKLGDICFAFPDVCRTQVGPAQVPIPYPNIGDLGDANNPAETVKIGGNPVITKKSSIPEPTKGAEPALPNSGVTSNTKNGPVVFKKYSNSVKAEGNGIVRMFDTTGQNCMITNPNEPSSATANAIGTVLGGEPTVLVGD